MPPPDPSTPTPPSVDTSQIVQASSDIATFNNMASLASDAMNKLQNDLAGVGVSLGTIGNMSRAQATQFGVLATSIVGAKESFTSFTNVDTSRLDTYTSQITDLFTIIESKGTAPGIASDAVKKMGEALIGMGVDSSKVKTAMSGTLDTFKDFALNTLKQIDNTRRLQNGFMQLAAQAGDLGPLYKAVGDDLSNLDNVTQSYSSSLTQSMIATHTRNIDVMAKYAAALTAIPGGLTAIKDQSLVAGTSTTILSAAVNYAIGSQREYKDVINDMQDAVVKYGVKIDDALKFTARISEISERYGARMEDVRTALNNSADAFKMFTTGGEGASNMLDSISQTMSGFIGQMKEIGVPAKNAMEMFNNITQRIQGMSEAQAAFLSSTTGGFSDLRGVFQIDEMLGKGDFQGVYQKITSQIRQMTGNIVSREEAAASPQAAEQYMRQIQILRQGPMGQLAKSRQEAELMLESMRKGATMPTPAALEDPTQNVVKQAQRGNQIGEMQTTILSNIETQLEAIRLQAGNALTPGFQNALAMRSSAGGAGLGGTGVGINTEFRQGMQMMTSAAAGRSALGPMATTFQNVEATLFNMPKDLKGAFTSVVQTFTQSNKENISQSKANLDNSIKQLKSESTLPGQNQTNLAPQMAGYFSPGQQIGTTVRTAQTQAAVGGTGLTAPGGIGNTPSPFQGRAGPIPVILSGDNKFTITMNCPHCGTKYEQTAYGRVNNTTPK